MARPGKPRRTGNKRQDAPQTGATKHYIDLKLIDFSKPKVVERLFAGYPIEWVKVVRARTLLRILPQITIGIGPKGGGARKYAREAVLPAFRALSVLWMNSRYPDHGLDFFRRELIEARSLLDVSFRRLIKTGEIDPATAMLRTIAHTMQILEDNELGKDFGHLSGAIFDAVMYDNESAHAVADDIRLLLKGISPIQLATKPLWQGLPPFWYDLAWPDLKTKLLKLDNHWEVWTDWYEARVSGARSNRRLEIARLSLEEAAWSGGPEAVNSLILELYEKDKSPPNPPDSPGPRLIPTPAGFEITPTIANDAELTDSAQISLNTQLRRRIQRLRDSMPRLQNTHKQLFDEFTDYTNFADVDLPNIDIPSLWSAGAALNDMVEAIARIERNTNRRTLIEPLEPDVLSQLRSLMRDHTALIMGFAQGQELAAKAAALRLLDLQPADLAKSSHNALAPMLATPSLLAEHASTLIRVIDRALEGSDEITLALASAGISTATRSIVAFGRALAPYVVATAAVSGVTGINIMTLAGDPNAETLRAALRFFIEHANVLAAFVSHDVQLEQWVNWLISEIRRSVPSTQ